MTHGQSRIRRAFVRSVLCGVFLANRGEDVDELELVLRCDRRAQVFYGRWQVSLAAAAESASAASEDDT